MRNLIYTTFVAFWILLAPAAALFQAIQNSTHLTLQNDRLFVAVAKSNGHVVSIILDSQDLLGPRNGNSGQLYLDCSCTPDGVWAPGGSRASLQLIEGLDSSGTPYGGVVMSDTYASTNQTLAQYIFLRGQETGLHMFSRATYFNESRPFLRGMGELRTMFRPNTNLWTHLSSSEDNWAPIRTTTGGITVQDATTYVNDTNDAYNKLYSEYFTKYTFSELWRDHDTHGQFADGTKSIDGNTYGAWLVHNTRETYYGGPLHSDLLVDGIVYNYIVSGHHGSINPNLTHGFDRTYGPQYYHFNKGGPNTKLRELRVDAAQYADPEWNAAFYDDIAKHVPNYVPSSGRTTFKAKMKLPAGAKRPIAVLSESGSDFQLNVVDPKALQYWAYIKNDGTVTIPRVRKATYRLTVYADGVFGWFIQDGIVVSGSRDGRPSQPLRFEWKPESHGREIWRIGTPDKSSGEYRHGFAPDTSRPLAPEQYRIYWAKWDFVSDFPNGVRFVIGKSKEAIDWNYAHWSVFGGKANYNRPVPVLDKVNNWTIEFDLKRPDLQRKQQATFTIQLAGAKTASGNTKQAIPGEKYSFLPLTVAVNGAYEDTWVIPPIRSGSCAVRSQVTCQNTEKKFKFPVSLLKEGKNTFVLSLPYNGTNTEPALLPENLYVQYDALRLEIM